MVAAIMIVVAGGRGEIPRIPGPGPCAEARDEVFEQRVAGG